MSEYPFTHWVVTRHNGRAVAAHDRAELDVKVARFLKEDGQPVQVAEYNTPTADSRTLFVGKWTVRPKKKGTRS